MHIQASHVQVHIARFDESRGRFLHLVLRRSADRKKYPHLWQVVTGSIDEGETALQAAIRETREETGLTALRLWSLPKVASYYWLPSDAIILAPVFAMLVDTEELVLSEEHESYEWLDAEAAAERVGMPSQKEGIPLFEEIINGRTQDFFEIASEHFRGL